MTPPVCIVPVHCDRDRYRDLLLLADEQWDMVELYLHRGEMFAAYAEDEPRTKIDSELVFDRALGCMIVTDEGVDERGLRIAEVKSLQWRRRISAEAWGAPCSNSPPSDIRRLTTCCGSVRATAL